MYPVSRGSSILPMLVLRSDSSIKYHIWLGHLAMAFFTAHGLVYLVFWIITHRLSKVPKQKDGSQCGFYVMMYMKEIIMHVALDAVHSLDDVFKIKDYEKKDIDEMRMEWAETVQEFMYA